MSVRFGLRIVLAFVCVLQTTSGMSQDTKAIPPSLDPTFWGQKNAPYTLKLTQTNTIVNGNNAPQTHVMVMNTFRNSDGLVREESFYDNGRPMAVSIRDPGKSTNTIMYIVTKQAVVAPIHPPGTGWTVERLPSRVIDSFQAEGLRFTRTIPASADGTEPPGMVIEEDWISSSLGIVLEQIINNPRLGTTTKTVAQFERVEPDATLFKIDLSGYSVQQVGQPAQ
jgi:hypothetical protein